MNLIDPKKQKTHSDSPVSTRRGPVDVLDPDAPSDQDDQARMSNEGGTEGQVGDTSGPGAGYDGEPAQVQDRGGVSS